MYVLIWIERDRGDDPMKFKLNRPYCRFLFREKYACRQPRWTERSLSCFSIYVFWLWGNCFAMRIPSSLFWFEVEDNRRQNRTNITLPPLSTLFPIFILLITFVWLFLFKDEDDAKFISNTWSEKCLVSIDAKWTSYWIFLFL